jgi:hypothetical protein
MACSATELARKPVRRKDGAFMGSPSELGALPYMQGMACMR